MRAGINISGPTRSKIYSSKDIFDWYSSKFYTVLSVQTTVEAKKYCSDNITFDYLVDSKKFK